MSDERKTHDETRRAHERALETAGEGEERAAKLVLIAADHRRRGQVDLAAFAVEEAISLGASPDLAGSELAALLALDAGDPGAYRALHSFTAVPWKGEIGAFPIVAAAGSVDLLLRKAKLFHAVFRSLREETTLALARSVVGITQGPSRQTGAEEWGRLLSRGVSSKEARGLDELYGRLLACARRRETVRADHAEEHHVPMSGEVLAAFVPGVGFNFQGAFLARTEDRPRFVIFNSDHPRGATRRVLEDAPPSVAPKIVVTTAYSLVVATDSERGKLYVSFLGRDPGTLGSRRDGGLFLGKGVSLAAVCPIAQSVAVFAAPMGRAFTISDEGAVSEETRLGPGFEYVSVASRDAEIVALIRSASAAFLLRLDSTTLSAIGEPVPLPPVRLLKEARLEWPSPEHLVVIEAPDVAHVIHAKDLALAWTATIKEPLDDLTSIAVDDEVELLAFGTIESELGAPDSAVGLARWTLDGRGRHGPTVRIEAEPGNRVEGAVKIATAGRHVALAFSEGGALSLRLLELSSTPATYPAPREWTYAVAGEAPGAAAGAGSAG